MKIISRYDRNPLERRGRYQDRKSTRLNSSHGYISYAGFCLKKKSTAFASVGLAECRVLMTSENTVRLYADFAFPNLASRISRSCAHVSTDCQVSSTCWSGSS